MSKALERLAACFSLLRLAVMEDSLDAPDAFEAAPKTRERGPRSSLLEDVVRFRSTLNLEDLPCELPREDMRQLTESQLRARYAGPKLPVLLRHATEGWAAKHTWSSELFLERFGDLALARQDEEAKTHPGRRQKVSEGFGVDSAAVHDNLRFFLREDEHHTLHAAIASDVEWPRGTAWPAETFRRIRGQRILSLSTAGTSNRIHRHAEAWQAQVHGLKLWWLVSPSAVSPGSSEDIFGHWGGDPCRYVMGRMAPPSVSYRCIVGPGSAVYVPTDYFHGTCSLDNWTIAYGSQGVKAPKAYVTGNGSLSSIESTRGSAVDLLKADEDGMTIAHWGAVDGHVELLRELEVRRALRASVATSSGMQPLHFAATSGHLAVVQHLLRARASSRAVVGDSGQQPLHMAASHGHVEVAEELLAGRADPSARSAQGASPLLLAAASGHEAVVQQLVSSLGSSPGALSAADSQGWQALHWAANAGESGVAEVLLARRASFEARTSDGQQPLHIAMWPSSTSVAELLLMWRASPDVSDHQGVRPLHHAAKNGHRLAMELLLGSSVDVEARDAAGRTALHWAAHEGRLVALEALVWHRAAVEVPCEEGLSALHVAASAGHSDAVQLLVDKGASVVLPAQPESMLARLPVFGWMLHILRRMTFAGEQDGWHALHFALASGHLAVAKTLVRGRADLAARDAEGRRPLDLVAERSFLHVASTLGRLYDCTRATGCPSGFSCAAGSCKPCPGCYRAPESCSCQLEQDERTEL